MNKYLFLGNNEILKYGKNDNLSLIAKTLLKHQKENWELVNKNFAALDNIKIKKFSFSNYYIKAQFNPSRIISSSANVDKKSIQKRPCFLCSNNLPETQKGINYKNKFILLCNPYPIFKEHLTIPHKDHIPQQIKDYFFDMLKITYDLKDNFFVFYNGPKCGASAPDHLHFQAGLKNSTPLESYYLELLKFSKVLINESDLKLLKLNSGFLNYLYLQSNNIEKIEKNFIKIYDALQKYSGKNEEPLLNIFTFYDNNLWHIFVIPRKQHRPKEFFMENENKILMSPAAVDMAGLCITPRKEDFNKLSIKTIKDIYSQVLFSKEELNKILYL